MPFVFLSASNLNPCLFSICLLVHLDISLQLQQMKMVPGDKTWSLVGKVYASKAGLAWPQVCLTDRVEVAPDKVVINGDVPKLGGGGGVAIRSKYFLIPKNNCKEECHVVCYFHLLQLP